MTWSWMVCIAAGAGLGAVLLTGAGCAGKRGDGAQYTRYPSGVKNRPRVEASAAELYVTPAAVAPEGGPGRSELDFFDELESRAEVVNDDALHACLLLGTGASLTDYDERVVVAQRLGWLRRQPARPPREAATIGEVSRMIVRMMGEKRRLTPARATQRLQELGLLPDEAKHYQGLTGAQMVSLLGQVEEALGPAALATVRRTAHDSWYAQAVVDDSDEAPAAASPAGPAPAPATTTARPAAKSAGPDPARPDPVMAEPAPGPKRMRGTPLRAPGN